LPLRMGGVTKERRTPLDLFEKRAYIAALSS
jgi:hypothetical protein